MDQPRMWREFLFLLLPLLTLVGITLMSGCGRTKKEPDPYADLHFSREEFRALMEEDRKISKLLKSGGNLLIPSAQASPMDSCHPKEEVSEASLECKR